MGESHSYIRDGAEIYRNSFAIIRAEADLSRFAEIEEKIAVRIIHACGMTNIVGDIEMSPTFATGARAALLRGAPVLCDAKMVAHGITRSRLPKGNNVVCTLDDPAVARLAAEAGNRRRLRGRGRIQRSASLAEARTVSGRARPQGRQRDGRCGDQRAGE